MFALHTQTLSVILVGLTSLATVHAQAADPAPSGLMAPEKLNLTLPSDYSDPAWQSQGHQSPAHESPAPYGQWRGADAMAGKGGASAGDQAGNLPYGAGYEARRQRNAAPGIGYGSGQALRGGRGAGGRR